MSISLQQVDVVAICNGLRISLGCTSYHCVSCRNIIDQEVKSALIAGRLDNVAKHLRIFGMQSDLIVADRRACEVVHRIDVQENASLG